MMLPDLTSPATQTVLPMNDSLYGASHVELDRQGPVILTLPADHDGRYYSVSVMDAHWNNTLHLGPRWSGRDRVEVLLVPPGWQGQAPAGMRVVESPTVSVCLLNRVLVTYDDGDLDRVRSWRNGFRITPLSGELVDVPHDDLVHPEAQSLADPWRYFQLGFDHVRRNPLPAAVAPVLARRGRAGPDEGRGRAMEPCGRRVRRRRRPGDRRRDAHRMAAQGGLDGAPTVAGPAESARGREMLRCSCSRSAATTASEAVYFFGDADADGHVLDGSDDAVYELVFPAGAQPPVRDGGFWSLTMYGADNLLVDNAIGRYSTRPTRPGFRERADGSIAITLSRSLPDGRRRGELAPRPRRPVPARTAGVLPDAGRRGRNMVPAGSQAHRMTDPAPPAGSLDLSGIARRAVPFGLPTVDLHRILVNFALDPRSAEFKAPLNQIHHARSLADPNDRSVVAMNVDTPYSYAWLDLRSGPVLLTMPPHSPERYMSAQIVDLYTYIVGYVSPRTVGNLGGTFLISGPVRWPRGRSGGRGVRVPHGTVPGAGPHPVVR